VVCWFESQAKQSAMYDFAAQGRRHRIDVDQLEPNDLKYRAHIFSFSSAAQKKAAYCRRQEQRSFSKFTLVPIVEVIAT
jgi:hypothetical protein